MNAALGSMSLRLSPLPFHLYPLNLSDSTACPYSNEQSIGLDMDAALGDTFFVSVCRSFVSPSPELHRIHVQSALLTMRDHQPQQACFQVV